MPKPPLTVRENILAYKHRANDQHTQLEMVGVDSATGHGVEREQQVVFVQEVHDDNEQGGDDGHAFDVSFEDIVQM